MKMFYLNLRRLDELSSSRCVVITSLIYEVMFTSSLKGSYTYIFLIFIWLVENCRFLTNTYSKREEDALEAFKAFNGRWYAGKQLSCEFTLVNKWKSAICGRTLKLVSFYLQQARH